MLINLKIEIINLIIELTTILMATIWNLAIMSALLEKRVSKRTSVIGTIVLFIIAIVIYTIGKLSTYNINGILARLIIPLLSMVYFYSIAKYRDGRFWVVFFLVETISACTYFVGRFIMLYLHCDPAYMVIFNMIHFSILTFFIKKIYLNLKRTLKEITTGWRLLAIVSGLSLVTVILFTVNTEELQEYSQYYLLCIWLCLFVYGLLLVFLKIIGQMHKMHLAIKEQDLLQTKIALQESQLELQKIYYKMAYVDALTQLSNRAAYEMKIEMLKETAENVQIGIITFDLNYLKQVNDTLGHHLGDQLLKDMAYVLRETFDEVGDVYRMGGDEFAVLLCGLSEEELCNKLEELQILMMVHNQSSEVFLEAAFGYAIGFLFDEKEKLEDMIIRADQRMYENKRIMKQ